MTRYRLLAALFISSLVLMSSLLSASVAWSHGWVTQPPSRQDHCAKGTTSFDCGPVKYEPQSVEAPKGSMLCSGGGSFRILDDNSRPWPVTNIDSTVTIRWRLTAAHRTSTWEYFVDGRLHASINQGGSQPPSDISHTLTGLPSGRHTILARWNIYDTAAAFYNCIDVNVGGSSTATPITRTPTPITRTPTPITPTQITPTPITPTPVTGIIFSDNFESDKGWIVNPSGTDTATLGQWERGVPESTNYNGAKQIGAASPSNDLVTGRLAGSSVGAYDLDGGVTSIRSPSIALPSSSNLSLSFSYYLAHATNATSSDYLRVKIVGSTTTTVFEKLGSATNLNAGWQNATINLSSYAGQTVHVLIEAADVETASLLEAAVDDMQISGGTGSTPTSTPITRTPTPTTPTPITPTPITPTPSDTPTPICAVQGPPSGKVLVGYWESWDGSQVHPGMGHIPLSQSHTNYNVLDLAFPVLLSDGTALWEDGMDRGVDVPTPDEMCAEKAKGRRLLLSIGGAAAGMDLSSRTVAQRFVDTIVPILKKNNFDGIDIDIETGLVAGSSWSQNSASQNNLIYIIDSVLAQMPANFMLTMAPETAYVTGGQIAYGGPWGAYLPIIKKYLDNGRLNWLQMQYYNGNMYGCPPPGATYQAGTVAGFVEQTKCMMNGFQVAGGGPTITIPASKIVVGLPAQPGAGGGYMSPSLVRTAYGQVSSIRGLMTWSVNWDGSRGWTFATNKPW